MLYVQGQFDLEDQDQGEKVKFQMIQKLITQESHRRNDADNYTDKNEPETIFLLQIIQIQYISPSWVQT